MKKILYLAALIFYYIFAICFVFVFIISILSFLEKESGLDIPFITLLDKHSDFNAQIDVPFTGAVFKYNFSYTIVFMWLWLCFYSIYFYTLKEFFKIFTKENLFTKASLNKLVLFFKLNFIPIIANGLIIIYGLISNEIINFEEEISVILFHTIIGIIVYLYIDVFRKGEQLQNENDLTI